MTSLGSIDCTRLLDDYIQLSSGFLASSYFRLMPPLGPSDLCRVNFSILRLTVCPSEILRHRREKEPEASHESGIQFRVCSLCRQPLLESHMRGSVSVVQPNWGQFLIQCPNSFVLGRNGLSLTQAFAWPKLTTQERSICQRCSCRFASSTLDREYGVPTSPALFST